MENHRQLELEPLFQIMMILESVMFSLSLYKFSLRSGLVHWSRVDNTYLSKQLFIFVTPYSHMFQHMSIDAGLEDHVVPVKKAPKRVVSSKRKQDSDMKGATDM